VGRDQPDVRLGSCLRAGVAADTVLVVRLGLTLVHRSDSPNQAAVVVGLTVGLPNQEPKHDGQEQVADGGRPAQFRLLAVGATLTGWAWFSAGAAAALAADAAATAWPLGGAAAADSTSTTFAAAATLAAILARLSWLAGLAMLPWLTPAAAYGCHSVTTAPQIRHTVTVTIHATTSHVVDRGWVWTNFHSGTRCLPLQLRSAACRGAG
jgi:hypothetical protein